MFHINRELTITTNKENKIIGTLFLFIYIMFVGTETLNPCQAVEGDHVKKRFFYLFLNQDDFNFKKAILCVLLKRITGI